MLIASLTAVTLTTPSIYIHSLEIRGKCHSKMSCLWLSSSINERQIQNWNLSDLIPKCVHFTSDAFLICKVKVVNSLESKYCVEKNKTSALERAGFFTWKRCHLGHFIYLSVPECPHLLNEENDTYFEGWLWGFSELVCFKGSGTFLWGLGPGSGDNEWDVTEWSGVLNKGWRGEESDKLIFASFSSPMY